MNMNNLPKYSSISYHILKFMMPKHKVTSNVFLLYLTYLVLISKLSHNIVKKKYKSADS